MKKRMLVAMTLLVSLGGCSSDKSAQDTKDQVSLADFFAYSCMQAYSKQHALPAFDNSVAYAVENSGGSAEDFARLYAEAETFAAQLPAADSSDPEHGGVAVMAKCLEQSRKL